MVDQAAGDRDRRAASSETVADERFEELLAESSLGSSGARALRGRVSDDQVGRLRHRVAEVDVEARYAAAVDEVMGRERRQATEALFDDDGPLTPFDRQLLVLAMNGWTFAAIAKILEVTIATVHRRYRRIYEIGSRVEGGESLLAPPRRLGRSVRPDATR